ncbi:MAG: SSI family serine proteinase inhibitor [Actinomycetes bacterium]
MRPHRLAVLALSGGALLLPLTGCGNQSSDGGGGDGTVARATAGTELTVTVTPSEGASPKKWTLSCDPAEGDHPHVTKACTALEKAERPFAPVPKGQVCTEIFGGPQVATVTGTWKGEKVSARYTRQNGCEMERWDRVAPVFPVDVGI